MTHFVYFLEGKAVILYSFATLMIFVTKRLTTERHNLHIVCIKLGFYANFNLQRMW